MTTGKESAAERRMAENEAYFRKKNEEIEQGLLDLASSAKDEGYESFDHDTDFVLKFHCECADEDCHQRIAMSMSDYTRIHEERDCFVIVPGHVVTKIEKVRHKAPSYWVVEKYITPTDNPQQLHATPLRHA